jgi:hypothetical protein
MIYHVDVASSPYPGQFTALLMQALSTLDNLHYIYSAAECKLSKPLQLNRVLHSPCSVCVDG